MPRIKIKLKLGRRDQPGVEASLGSSVADVKYSTVQRDLSFDLDQRHQYNQHDQHDLPPPYNDPIMADPVALDDVDCGCQPGIKISKMSCSCKGVLLYLVVLAVLIIAFTYLFKTIFPSGMLLTS